jgi:hypothetical protein
MRIFDKENEKILITPSEMKDGEIGIIEVHVSCESVGRIIQRYQDLFIVLGETNGCSFTSASNYNRRDFLIRILPKGTLLEI